MSRLLVAVVVLALATGCSGARHTNGANQPQSDEQMRLTFRATFLNSCEKGVPGAQGIQYCSCTEDKIESGFNDTQLAALKPLNPKLRAMMHACAKKAGLRVRAGQ